MEAVAPERERERERGN